MGFRTQVRPGGRSRSGCASRSSPRRAAATTTPRTATRHHGGGCGDHCRRHGDHGRRHRDHGGVLTPPRAAPTPRKVGTPPSRPRTSTEPTESARPPAGRAAAAYGRVPGDRRLDRRRGGHRRRALRLRPAVRAGRAAGRRGRAGGHRVPEPRGRPQRQLPRVHPGRPGRGRVHQHRARRLRRRHPERRPGPPDRARRLQDGDLARRLAALRQRTAGDEPVPDRVQPQLLRQPAPDLPGGRRAGVVGTPITSATSPPRACTRSAAAAAASACTPASSSSPPPIRGRSGRVPWADTPPGVVCYYDLEAKPLDVLNGTVPGEASGPARCPTSAHRRAGQAGDAGRDPAGHRGPRVRSRRHHLLGPGRRLLEPRRRARPPGLDPRQHPAGAVGRLPRLRGDGGGRRRWPTASTSSAPAAP